MTYRTNYIGNMANTRPTSSAQVEHFFSRCDVYVIHTAKNARSELAPERIPYPILDFCSVYPTLDCNPLFTVYALPRYEVLGYE